MTREDYLAQALTQWAYEYYETGEAAVDDQTFNDAEDELRLLNPNHPVLSMVGYGYDFSGVAEKDKFEHPIFVGSITKEKNIDEVIKWIGDRKCRLSSKIDGNSIVHYYRNGKYWRSGTRGRNNIGIDRSVKFVKKVPMEVPFLRNFSVRGEAAISKANYTAENGFNIEKSSRNIVAGIISRKDDWETQMEFVDFLSFTFNDTDTGEDLYDLFNWGDYFKVETQDEFTLEYIKDIEKFKAEYKDNHPYECDGAVFKSPTGSLLAFKFEDEKRLTIGEGYDITVGIDQRFTPVLLLKPVNMNGAMLSRASLGSFGRAIREGFWPLYENHVVEIIRTNEILPYATRVVSKGEYLLDDNALVPNCPVCGTPGEADGEHYYCVNPTCPNIEQSKLLRFAEFFYPEGIGNGVMTKVFRHFKVTEVLDLYTVSVDDIEYAKIPSVGNSQKEKIMVFFDNIRKGVDSKIIYQTFLRTCGRTFSRVIVESGFKFADIYENPDKVEALGSIKNFRKDIIAQMYRYAQFFKYLATIIDVVDPVVVQTVGTFCITGTRFNDIQLKKLEAKGWKEDSSVGKNTTVLVVADLDSTSGKVKKAQKYGIEIACIEDFIDKYLA